jgi:hypothetical protein
VSDARTAFFESEAAPKAKASRDDFFAGTYEPKVAEKKASAGRGGSAPSEATLGRMRNNPATEAVDSLIADPMASIRAIPTSINRGVVDILGMPMDALTAGGNLASAGLGWMQSKITGEAPSSIFNPVDPASVPGTGEWNAQMLDSSPMGPVTQLQDPENAAARLVYGAGRAIPGAMTGRQMLSGATGGGAATVAAESGADPATQAVVGAIAGRDTPQSGHKSAGAAAAAVDMERLSPELRAGVARAVQQTGGAINPEVLARQIQADSLPVKVRLSEGQALGDPRMISLEQNARGKHEIYSKGFQQQNKDLVENLRVMREEQGPEVFSTNAVEHADTLIGRYKTIDDERRAAINTKYKALEEANGGQFPVDGAAFISAADAALAKKMKGRYLPSEVRGDIEEFRDNAGFMTFEQFENLRTNLATEARKAERAGDGNAAAAVNLVRRELEALPMSAENTQLKSLADDARKAKERFDALDADPAYKAAVNDSVAPDAFVQKYIVNGTRDNVAKLRAAMDGDDTAVQTIKVATLDHLRKSAGIDPGYNGNFTQAGYNKALQQLEPKLLALLDPKSAETARTLGDVARYTQFQPKGSFVNNSNTFVSAAAEKAADALEGIIDFKAGGIPIASTIRKQLNENKIRKSAEATFAPGAGLTKLSDITKVGKEKK